MSDSPAESSKTPDPSATDSAAPRESPPHTPVKRVAAPQVPPAKVGKAATSGPPAERRDFFSDAMREALIPLSGLLERKINPLLAALEAIPDEVDRFTNSVSKAGTALDQPMISNSGQQDPPAGTFQGETPLRILRPPGAAHDAFESRCSACGKCVEACPAQAIRLDQYQLIAGGLPYVVGAQQPCVVCTPLACMNVCPTGALQLTDRLKIQMGTAKVNLDLCLRENGEDCRLCLEACPIMGEGAGPAGDALVIHAATGRLRVRRNVCIGCGMCESRCPTHPPAITVEPYRPPIDPIVA